MEDVPPARWRCLPPPEPPMTPEEEDAHAEAVRRIRDAYATGVDWLDLGDLPIEVVPAEIRILKDQLRVLALGKHKLVRKEGTREWVLEKARRGHARDITPLASLTGLTTLDLSYC